MMVGKVGHRETERYTHRVSRKIFKENYLNSIPVLFIKPQRGVVDSLRKTTYHQ